MKKIYKGGSIDIVLPVHNEGEAIAGVLREFYHEVAVKDGIPVRFILMEDGSTDDTVPVIQALSKELPIVLDSSPSRRGYSRAVIEGLRRSESDLVACLDSDGQYEPSDFKRLLENIQGVDIVVGNRSPRSDVFVRRAMSSSFGAVYKSLFPVRLKDPSCSFLIIRRPAIVTLLSQGIGVLKQGFWWEFMARAQLSGLKIREINVAHRPRAAGITQVYRPTKVPRIAYEHIRGLFQIRREFQQPRQ